MSVIFRETREVNYRAVRNMGLAAWWGASLFGLGGVERAAEEEKDPLERFKVVDRSWRYSRPFMAAAVGSYVLGTELVRFDGKVVDNHGVPLWMTKGVESKSRVAALVVALVAAIASRKLREQGTEIYENERRRGNTGESEEAERLRTQSNLLHAVVPAAVGWLLYSHTKEDAKR